MQMCASTLDGADYVGKLRDVQQKPTGSSAAPSASSLATSAVCITSPLCDDSSEDLSLALGRACFGQGLGKQGSLGSGVLANLVEACCCDCMTLCSMGVHQQLHTSLRLSSSKLAVSSSRCSTDSCMSV